MGREVKRVATSFEWTLEKTWEGYINPFYQQVYECSACEGSGYSPMAKFFSDQWYGFVEFDPVSYGSKLLTIENPGLIALVKRSYPSQNLDVQKTKNEYKRLLKLLNNQWSSHLIVEDVLALLKEDCLWDFTRVKLKNHSIEEYIQTRAYYLWIEAGQPAGNNHAIAFWEQAEKEYSGHWLPFTNGYIPTPEEVNAWNLVGFGHNGSYVCIKARCEREGHESNCEVCNGNGRIWQPIEAEQWAEEWEPEEPPSGDAYQIWETISEGSPISPAFSNPRILAEWMANSSSSKITADQWLEWIVGPGWAPSGAIVDGTYKDGITAMTK